MNPVPYDPARMCARHFKYTRNQAVAIKSDRNHHLKPNEPPYNAFKCSSCRHWHIGHSRPMLVS